MACEDLNKALQTKASALSDKFKAVMQGIGDDIRKQTEGIDPNLDTSGPDVWVGMDFDVDWKEQRFVLHLPEVTLKDQTIILDLPQVTMKTQEIIFHTPSIRMVRKKTGQYPEFYCDTSTVIPKCEVRWSDIIMDVPEPFMEEQKIILDLPEFRMDTTSFVMGVPEFKMVETEIILHLPEFKLRNISIESEKARARGEALKEAAKRRTEEATGHFREQNKAELGIDIAGLFDCYRTELFKARDVSLAQIEGTITGTQAAIDALLSRKAPDDDPTLSSMRANIAKMRETRTSMANGFQQKLDELEAGQKRAVDGLVNIRPD